MYGIPPPVKERAKQYFEVKLHNNQLFYRRLKQLPLTQELLREVEDHYGATYARVNVLVLSHYRLVEELTDHLTENYEQFNDAENHFADILKFKVHLLNGKIIQM